MKKNLRMYESVYFMGILILTDILLRSRLIQIFVVLRKVPKQQWYVCVSKYIEFDKKHTHKNIASRVYPI